MNERIKELAEQAWDDTKEKFGSFVDDGGEVDFTFLHEWTEKFAELIVKECANVAADHEALDIYEEIREHFGVEE
jgi:hypothetical protein